MSAAVPLLYAANCRMLSRLSCSVGGVEVVFLVLLLARLFAVLLVVSAGAGLAAVAGGEASTDSRGRTGPGVVGLGAQVIRAYRHRLHIPGCAAAHTSRAGTIRQTGCVALRRHSQLVARFLACTGITQARGPQVGDGGNARRPAGDEGGIGQLASCLVDGAGDGVGAILLKTPVRGVVAWPSSQRSSMIQWPSAVFHESQLPSW